MSNFIPKAFLELERLMHPVTADKMKDSFIQRIKAKYAQQENFPETMDNEKGILTYLKKNTKKLFEKPMLAIGLFLELMTALLYVGWFSFLFWFTNIKSISIAKGNS